MDDTFTVYRRSVDRHREAQEVTRREEAALENATRPAANLQARLDTAGTALVDSLAELERLQCVADGALPPREGDPAVPLASWADIDELWSVKMDGLEASVEDARAVIEAAARQLPAAVAERDAVTPPLVLEVDAARAVENVTRDAVAHTAGRLGDQALQGFVDRGRGHHATAHRIAHGADAAVPAVDWVHLEQDARLWGATDDVLHDIVAGAHAAAELDRRHPPVVEDPAEPARVALQGMTSHRAPDGTRVIDRIDIRSVSLTPSMVTHVDSRPVQLGQSWHETMESGR